MAIRKYVTKVTSYNVGGIDYYENNPLVELDNFRVLKSTIDSQYLYN